MATSNVSLAAFMTRLKQEALFLGHQFQVTIPEITDAQLFATATTVPAKTNTAIDVPYLAHTFKMPGVTEYAGEWSCTLRLPGDIKTKKEVSEWMKKASDLSKNGAGDKTIPDVNIKIDLLGSDLKSIKATYNLVGVFPTTDGEISLSTESADLVTLDVTFAYQYHYEGDSNNDPLK